jgi:hemin uptake protein HemP
LLLSNANDYYSIVEDQGDQDRLKLKPPSATPVPPRRILSRELLGPHGELVIEHQGREYHLRLTQNGKLILTA